MAKVLLFIVDMELKPLPGVHYILKFPDRPTLEGDLGDTGQVEFCATAGKNVFLTISKPGYMTIEGISLGIVGDTNWRGIYRPADTGIFVPMPYTGTTNPCGDQPPPIEPPADMGPQIVECVFPTLSLNFIAVMSGLASWLGCMVHNLIVLIQWIVDWILHFPDHLDAWISRLFGVDPSLPFFDEIMKKIDIWISGKFGVDPALPFWEELVKKAIVWLSAGIDEASRKAIQRLK